MKNNFQNLSKGCPHFTAFFTWGYYKPIRKNKLLFTMGHQPATRHVIITNCSLDNDDFRRLYLIFRTTICPCMSERAFESYYYTDGLEYIDVSFFYTSTGEITGFLAAAFYARVIGGRVTTVARSAIGQLPQYRGGALRKWALYGKYMAYKWRHPGRRLVLTVYASNPYVYRMMCKYTGIIYPRYNQPVPAGIVALKNDILQSNHLQRRERQPFVVRINFEVEKSNTLRQQAPQSTNPHVRYFVQQTGLQHCISLLVIIPVSFRNIFLCIWLLLWYSVVAQSVALCKTLMKGMKKNKNRLTCWLNLLVPAGYANRKPM